MIAGMTTRERDMGSRHTIADDSAIRVDVLGPVRVKRDGRSIALPPIQRDLLAILVVRRGIGITHDAIADRLWPAQEQPMNAGKVVQGHICRVRRAIGASSLQRDEQRYRLDMACVDTDLLRFELAVSDAEKHHVDEDPIAALATCDIVSSLWRGEPFEGVASAIPPGEVARLHELRRRCDEIRLDGLLRIGSYRDAVLTAESLVADDPMRESAWGALMVALMALGRSADALHAFSRARRSLAEALGLEPGRSLKWIEEQVVRGNVIRADDLRNLSMI